MRQESTMKQERTRTGKRDGQHSKQLNYKTVCDNDTGRVADAEDEAQEK